VGWLWVRVQFGEACVDAAGRSEESLRDTSKLDGWSHLRRICGWARAASSHAVVVAVLVVLVAGRCARSVLRSGDQISEDAASSRLPDPGLPGRDHPVVSVDRGCGRRLAGKPGVGSPVRAALTSD